MLVSTSMRRRSSVAFLCHCLSCSSRFRSSISEWSFASRTFYFSSRRFWRAFFSYLRRLTRSRHASDFSLSSGIALFTGSCKLRGIFRGCVGCLATPGDFYYSPFFKACSRLNYFLFYSKLAYFSRISFDFSDSNLILDITELLGAAV